MKPYRILIVEDDGPIAESLAEILEILGHQVSGTAVSGETFLLALKQEKPDLVLLDIQLKGALSGLDLAEMLQEQYHLPFIFTTAFADDAVLEKARATGPYGYLVKPYGIQSIKAAISVAMQIWEDRQNEKKSASETSDEVYLKVDQKLVKLKEREILYVEARGDYMLVKTNDRGYVVSSTLKALTAKLNPQLFFKVHRSYLVNLDAVGDIIDHTLVIGNKVIPVSRGQWPLLKERIRTL